MDLIMKIGNIEFRLDKPFVLIAGPCVIESYDMTMSIAEELKAICERLNIPLIFKASFDKANRSHFKSFRGLGFETGMHVLSEVKRIHQLPILTDVHEYTPLEQVAEVVDVLQIPAFLCRQTDFVINVSKLGKPVNIKKGQFMSPYHMRSVYDKAISTENQNIMVCERGFSFGYNDLIVDMRSLSIMGKYAPVIFDATHSVQTPGSGKETGGQRHFVPTLAKAAIATGICGLFMETHPDPDSALSDSATCWPLQSMETLLKELKDIDQLVKGI
jgi:2-dehydro-3-deoxyphosphooctonate aldolase (KDO 8-P synthase)